MNCQWQLLHLNISKQICGKKFKTSLSPKDDEAFLLKQQLLAQDEDEIIHPAVSGILLACEQPHEFLTNAFIQAVAYRGIERNAEYQRDARDITGPLDIQVVEAYKFVEKNMKIYADNDPARRNIPLYSMQAVFEALVNAVAHRDYSIQTSKIRLHMFCDRLEIFSPGSIPNTMTIESLPLRQSARNELLTSLLARCPIPCTNFYGDKNFFMEKRGEVGPIILAESKKLAGKFPVYRLLDDTELVLTIFAAQKSQHD